MIVKRFGYTAIHNKALYKCLIHSFIKLGIVCVAVIGDIIFLKNIIGIILYPGMELNKLFIY